MTATDNQMPAWEAARSAPELETDCVQVWFGNQDQSLEMIGEFHRSLSDDERSRASRFKFDRDRIHFIAARGMLRRLLGEFLKVSPGQVEFRYTEYGKPYLADPFASSNLKFNISHSAGRVLLAFAMGRELGVDIEHIRPDFATQDIAERFFSRLEVEKLRSLPQSVQAESFFNCWTRKEAYIKAIGEGLSCPLDKFDVTLAPEEPVALLATKVLGQPLSKWSMQGLDVGEAYRAALVVEGQGWDLMLRSYG